MTLPFSGIATFAPRAIPARPPGNSGHGAGLRPESHP
jgi:hypothetical protein